MKIFLVLSGLFTLALTAYSDTYQLKESMELRQDWNMPQLWHGEAGGTPDAMAGHDFATEGFAARTAESESTFEGASLTLSRGTTDGQGGGLLLKGNASVTALRFEAGNILHGATGELMLRVERLALEGYGRLGAQEGLTLALHADEATGTGTLKLGATTQNTGTYIVQIDEGREWSGTLEVAHGTLALVENLTLPAVSLVVPAEGSGRIDLQKDLAVAAAQIAGEQLGEGSHSAADLHQRFPEKFPAASGGTLTVSSAR